MPSSSVSASAASTASKAISPSTISKAFKILSFPTIGSIYPKLWFDKIPEPARFVTSAGLGNIIFFYIDIVLYDLVIHPLSVYDYDKIIHSSGGSQIITSSSGSTPSATSTSTATPSTKAVSPIIKGIVLLLLPYKKGLQKNKESISFFISYLIQILAQHFLNAFFVYGLDSIDTKDKYISTLVVTYSSYFVSLVGSTICNISLLRKGMSKNVAFWGTVIGFGLFNFFLLRFLIGREKEQQLQLQFEQEDDDKEDAFNLKKKWGKSATTTATNSNSKSKDKNKGNMNKKNMNKKKNDAIKNKTTGNAFTRKMRGGDNGNGNGMVHKRKNRNSKSKSNYNYDYNKDSLMTRTMDCIQSFVVRVNDRYRCTYANTNRNDDSTFAFIKSIGKGIDVRHSNSLKRK